MNHKPFVLLINGPIGSGKTTLANYLKKKLPKQTAFLEIDNIKYFLNCYRDICWQDLEKSRWYHKLSRLVIVDLAKTYTKRDINVVISSTWSLKLLKLMTKKLNHIKPIHILLTVSLENALKRIKKRNGKIFLKRQKFSHDFYSTQHDKNTILINADAGINSVRKKVLLALKGKII